MDYQGEKILVENDDMIVGQLETGDGVGENNSSHQQLLSHNNSSPLKFNTRKKKKKNSSGYTEVEDWILRSLDLLSPFDTDFISDHFRAKTRSEIEYRLNDPQFRLEAAEFKKVPIFIFELIFTRDRMLAHKCLMLLTTKEIIPLPCKSRNCQHDFTIPRAQLAFSPKSPYGFEVKELCDFVSKHVKPEHFPYLRRNVYTMEDNLEAANVDYRNMMPGGNTEPEKIIVTKDTLKSQDVSSSVKIDSTGRVIMGPDHQRTLRHIIKAIGKNKWEDATQLLLAVYDSEIDFDVEDVEIYKRVAGYYRVNLDLDQRMGPMTDTEDCCVIYLYKSWHKTMQGHSLWNHIARHIKSRTAPQIQNRLSRISQNPDDITLDNMKKYSEDMTNPASFHFHNAHVMSLTILPKSSSTVMDITTKLQHEVRFVVAGTAMELFMLPCKYTAIRCTHMGMEQNKFTYDQDRPSQQFITYLKLTFANSLKKAKLVDDSFDWTQIAYNGDDIHTIMKVAEEERFILPKEDFMRLNRRQVASTMMSPTLQKSPASPISPVSTSPSGPNTVTPSSTRGRGRGRGRPPSSTPLQSSTRGGRGRKRKDVSQ